jgi:ketosteroid isomerase-like protein
VSPTRAAAAAAAANKPTISDEDARALLDEWLAAQNQGDYPRYAALYAARFTGVRRTGDKTRAFDHAGWLADRKRMFEKPMQVTAEELQIARMGPSAVVRFEQQWSTASYRDAGPKQMVLVREPAGVRIAREELLRSSKLPAGGSSARFVTSVGERAYVLIAPSEEEPSGKALGVEIGPPSTAVFARGSAPEPASVAAWRGGSLRLIGAHGSCEMPVAALRIVAIGYPHFGVIMEWNGGDGQPATPMAKIAEWIAGYPAWYALELERPCIKGPVLALPPGAPPALTLPERKAEEALERRARTAFAALPAVRKLAAEPREELIGELSIKAYGRDQPEWVVAAGATPCSTGEDELALFRVVGDELVLQLSSRNTELLWVWALVDLDGDALPEVVGSPWAPDPWLLIEGRNGRVLQRAEIPYNDCPC